MIQDIYPSKLDNSFKDIKPNDNDCIFLFNDEGKIYAGDAEGKMVFLTFHDCKADYESALFSFIYLFSVDQKKYFLIESCSDEACRKPGFKFYSIRVLEPGEINHLQSN